jgi:hypothetical protein
MEKRRYNKKKKKKKTTQYPVNVNGRDVFYTHDSCFSVKNWLKPELQT